MFRQLYEGFNAELPASRTQLSREFNYTAPGSIRAPAGAADNALTPEMLDLMNYARREQVQQDLQKATNMAVNGQFAGPWMKGFANRFLGFQVPQGLIQMQNQCQAKSLNDIIAGYDSSKEYNCGIMYDANTDTLLANNGIGRGYLGTRAGPLRNIPGFSPVPSGTWDNNGIATKKSVDVARCDTIRSCASLANSPYASSCAWCSDNDRAIPVNSSKVPLYNDVGLTCASNKIIGRTDTCPAASPAAEAAARMDSSGNVCEDFRLTRACIIRQAREAGCVNDGSLITALTAGTSATEYNDALKNNQAFQLYQTRAANGGTPLLGQMFAAGNATMQAVLDNIQALKVEAQKTDGSALNMAARDLCLQRDAIEQFDFCAEDIQANRSGPFTLKCLQQSFRLKGGQGAGARYPTAANKAQYDANFANWAEVNAYFDYLKQQTESTDVTVQERALRDFLGVKRESLYAPQLRYYPNYEVYNFSSANRIATGLDGLFIGRNTREAINGAGEEVNGLPNFDSINFPNGKVTQFDATSMASFVLLMDLRPQQTQRVQFAFTAKDGVVLTVNKDMLNYSRDLIRNESEDFRRNEQRIAPAYIYNNECTTLAAKGNNRVKVYWNNQFANGLKTFKMMYTDCNQGGNAVQAKLIPKEWISLTQETDAPMLSFEYSSGNGFSEKRLPEFFPVTMNSVVSVIERSNYDDTNTDLDKINHPFVSFTGTSSTLRVNKFIHGLAFKAITVVFNVSQTVSTGVILSYNNLRMFMRGANNLVISTGTGAEKVFPIQVGKWYIAVIRINGNQTFQRNQLDLNVIPLRTARTQARESSLLSDTQSITVQRNNIVNVLNNDPINSSMFVLGSNSQMSGPTMSIGSLRIYDQNITGATVAKDARNSFARNWYD